MIRERKVKEPIVAITKAISEGKSLEKALDLLPMDKVIQDEADVIISFTQLKQQEEATVTASIKNIAMGWAPAEIHGYPKKNTGIHEDLHGFSRS